MISYLVRLLLTIIIGLIGTLIFSAIHFPLPWLLGPLAVLLVGARIIKTSFQWPPNLRNWGLIIIGYTSGYSINKDAFMQIIYQLPWMLAVTATLIGFSTLTAKLISRLSGIDYPSVLIGSIPGGLVQMVLLGEEMEDANLTVITLFQVMRLILIVFCVPLLIFSPLYSLENSQPQISSGTALAAALPGSLPELLGFAVISVGFVILAKKIKLPTPYLLGPILGIGALNILGLQGSHIPSHLLAMAQFSQGCYLGLLLKPEQLENKVKLISLAVINSLVLVLFSLGLSYILIEMHGIGAATSFLCTAPGGADQMGVIASVIAADVSLVTGYQLFRMLFVNLAVPSVLKRVFRNHLRDFN